MNICMIGAGYVGLVSGVCFSEFGWTVNCIDSDPERVAALQKGQVPIYEPGLEEMLERNIANGRISFSTDLAPAVRAADLIFLAVGTPMRRGDGYADLSYVYQAVDQIAPHLDHFTVITTKSTVPVGTGDEVERIIAEGNPHADFAVVSNPEFLREGSAIEDFRRPDRIVIGSDDDRARSVMDEVYRPLYLNAAPVFFVDRRTAELTKYAIRKGITSLE